LLKRHHQSHSDADGLFAYCCSFDAGNAAPKIDRSMPIVAETEKILNRQNSPLNSRAQIFDGSGRRFFIVRTKNLRWKISALRWLKMIEWEVVRDTVEALARAD
jgi:hypothetical protein